MSKEIMRKVGFLTAGAIGIMLLVPFASQAKTPTHTSHPGPVLGTNPGGKVVITANPAPTVSIVLPAVTRTLATKVTWTVGTPSGSAIAGYYLSQSSTDPLVTDGGWVPTRPVTFTFTAGDGTRTLYAWVKDHNNLVSAAASTTTFLDTTAPTVTISAPATTTTRNVAVTIGGNDSGGIGITNWALVPGTTAPAVTDTAWKTVRPTTYAMPLGNVTRTISAFARDKAGNVSVAATTTVRLALPAPTVTITMPAATRTLTLAVTVKTTDPGGTGIASYYLSESATPPLAGNPNWNINKPATFTFLSGDGPRTVYAWVKDVNGTVSASAQASTVLDTTLPTASLTAPASSTSRTISVTLGGSDAGSGITAWALVAGTTAPTATASAWVSTPPTSFTLSTILGAKTISAFSRDAAGNVSAPATKVVTFTPPLPTITLGVPTRTKTLGVNVTINTTDPGGTGIAAYILSSSSTVPGVGSASWTVNKPSTFTLPTGDGSKTVYAWVKDKNNSISLTASAIALLDTTAPTVTLTAPASSTTRNISLTITGTDAGSGITSWALVAGTTTPSVTDTAWKSSPVTSYQLPLGNGAKVISAFSRDAVGNVSLAGTKTVTLALAAPTVTLAMAANTKLASVPVTINTTDAGGTGIAGYYLSESVTAPTVGGGGWINKPSTFALSATDAVKTVYIWVKDNNGSLSARAQASTRLDTTLPTATLTTAATATAWNIAVTLGGADAGSGITAWSVVAGSTAPSASSNAWKSVAPTTFQLSSGNGVKTVSAFSRDAAGNVSLAATKTVTMTVPVPSVTISMTSPINYRNNPSLNPITNDPGQTGINGYFVSESGTTPLLTDPGWKPFVNITLSAGDGTKTVYLWVKDNNGSISARASATTLVDTTLPTATLAALTYGGTTTVAVTIGGTDAGSGITAWAVVEGTSAPSWGDPNWVTPVPTSIIVSDGTGIHTVSAFTRDAAGNVSLAATRTVTLP